MNLEQKVAARKARGISQASLDADVSPLFDEPEGTTILTFTEASANELYKAHDLAKWIKLQMKDWADEFCATVAIICSCLNTSLLPEEDRENAYLSVVHFIASLSLLQHAEFIAKFYEAFPSLKDFNKAIEDAKKN